MSQIELIGVSGPALGDEQRRLVEGCAVVAVSRSARHWLRWAWTLMPVCPFKNIRWA